jgi:hypothetical protein
LMGEFISKGIAIGFACGVTVALIARRHPLTRKHPNLVGILAAGGADAISRDYRRPSVYEKLLKLDTPLAAKGQEILFNIRTGGGTRTLNFGDGPDLNGAGLGYDKPAVTTVKQVSPDEQPQQQSTGWWVDAESQDQSDQTNSIPHQVVRGGPFSGTKTWDEIRREGKF